MAVKLLKSLFFFAAIFGLALGSSDARADGGKGERRKHVRAPGTGFVANLGYTKGYATDLIEKRNGYFGEAESAVVVDVSMEDAPATKEVQPAASESVEKLVAKEISNGEKPKYRPVFDSDEPSKKIVPPDEDAPIAINKDASGPALGLVTAYQAGDMETAGKYADQWVRYQQNFVFTVREITGLIGKALVKQGEIDEEDWVGVPQLIDYEMAKTRAETGALFKPRHDIALDRIEPDPKNQVAVYYFFTLNCAWCRKMTPDVERLWRATKNDPNVRMAALTLGATPKDWIDEYRSYTGLTAPVFSGEKMARAFGVRYVPAIVVVTPNKNKAYLKTGKQEFYRLFEFIRRAQGLPASLEPEIQRIATAPIGAAEKTALKSEVEKESFYEGAAKSAKVKSSAKSARGKDALGTF